MLDYLSLEEYVVKIEETVEKLNVAIEDLNNYYFDSLKDVHDATLFKHLFFPAKTRNEIVFDYALNLKGLSAKLEEIFYALIKQKETDAT